MIKIKATLATTEPFIHLDKTMSFSQDDLCRMADTAAGLPITVDFNLDEVVGFIISAEVVESKLLCDIELKYKPFNGRECFLVPGTIFNEEEQKHEKLMACALTRNTQLVLPPL